MFIYLKWWSDAQKSVLKYKCLDLLVYALTYTMRKRHAHNLHIRINRIYQYADHGHIENICAYAENRNLFILSLFFICFSLLEKKERILCKKCLVFDNTGFTAALWGLSLTCALMTTKFGQLMALLRIYCHNLISR